MTVLHQHYIGCPGFQACCLGRMKQPFHCSGCAHCAGMYPVAVFLAATQTDMVSVMLRPLLFSGVLALTVHAPSNLQNLTHAPSNLQNLTYVPFNQ